MTQLTDKLFVRPQVLVEEIAELASAGFRGIINNRPEGEAPEQPSSNDLEAEASRHGMSYWHIPIIPGQMNEDDARAFKKALDQVAGPVVAFCRTGTRSSNLHNLSQQVA